MTAHCETGTLSLILESCGITVSEEMIFGIGSGIFFIYFKKHPVFSFAILWFFAGHVLESTVIPLELYFEHRNYLPALGIIFGISYYFLFFLQTTSSTFVKNTFCSLAILYFCGIGFISFSEASLWGNPATQAITWQSNHPNSKRANALAAQAWIDLNQPLKADSYFRNIAKIDTLDNASYLMRLEIDCFIQHIPPEEKQQILQQLENTKTENATVLTAQRLVSYWIDKKCPNLDATYLEKLLLSTLSNSSSSRHNSHLVSTLSLFYAAQNNYPAAIQVLDQYIKKSPNSIHLILLKIRWGIASQQHQRALQWINEARSNRNFSFLNKINFTNQLNIMEQDIKKIQEAS